MQELPPNQDTKHPDSFKNKKSTALQTVLALEAWLQQLQAQLTQSQENLKGQLTQFLKKRQQVEEEHKQTEILQQINVHPGELANQVALYNQAAKALEEQERINQETRSIFANLSKAATKFTKTKKELDNEVEKNANEQGIILTPEQRTQMLDVQIEMEKAITPQQEIQSLAKMGQDGNELMGAELLKYIKLSKSLAKSNVGKNYHAAVSEFQTVCETSQKQLLALEQQSNQNNTQISQAVEKDSIPSQYWFNAPETSQHAYQTFSVAAAKIIPDAVPVSSVRYTPGS